MSISSDIYISFVCHAVMNVQCGEYYRKWYF